MKGVRILLMVGCPSPIPLLVSFLDSVEVGSEVCWAGRTAGPANSAPAGATSYESAVLQLCGAVARLPHHFGIKPCLCAWPSNLQCVPNHLTTVVMALVILPRACSKTCLP